MNDAAPLLSILIVNWNARDFLRACLASIPTTEVPLEILVVDNASTDGSPEMLRTEFARWIASPETCPRLHVIASPTNLGFAAGNNLAARNARGKYFLLLNPDTTVPPHTLAALIEFAEAHPKMGAVGPALRNPDGSPQRSCWRGYPGLSMALTDALFLWKVPGLPLAERSEYRPEELKSARCVDHLLGACMLLRREAWEQVGALDENYFLFMEETDWCLRARRAGWEIYFDPDVYVTHFGQQSMRLAPSRNLPQFYKSYLRFYRTHNASPVRVFLLKAIIGLASIIRIGMWQLRQVRAANSEIRAHASAMTMGYWQTLQELRAY